MTKPIMISIEGNIGTGKSTLLDNLKEILDENIVVIKEPVDQWLKITDKNNNSILNNFYQDPHKFSFSFQILILKTMKDLLLKTINENPNCKLIICERSIMSSHHIFAKMLYDDSYMNHIEYNVYKCLYDEWSHISAPDKIIYLNVNAELCFNRIEKRKRLGEKQISLEYLQKCEKYHELWFESCSIPILKIEMNEDIIYDLNDDENLGFKWIKEIMAFF
jgi:deoxyadenosine/deoxycytidine kinase